jgi:transposase
MDFECIDAWLDLPECRVTNQVIRPHELARHLERRDADLVCPRCQGGCARLQDGRARCLRALPMGDRPVTVRLHLRRFQGSACDHRPGAKSKTVGDWVQWTERLYEQGRQECLHGCPGQDLARRSGLSARTVFRWTCAKSRGGRPRQRGRALGRDADARRKGPHDQTIIVDLEKGRPLTPCKGRRGEAVGRWCKSRPQAARDGVEVVVRERSTSLYASIRQVFGAQGEGMDRCPVVQQAVGALDRVVRSGQKPRNLHEAQERTKLRTRWLQLPHQLEIAA